MKKINCILLVDDNPADNKFHLLRIKKADVCNQVRIVEDGVLALEYLVNSAKPGMENEYPKADLIFLDINMPRMNGFEFLEEYHKLDEKLRSGIVITMLTTSLNPDDQKRAIATGDISEFVNKPLTVELLQAMAEKYFQ